MFCSSPWALGTLQLGALSFRCIKPRIKNYVTGIGNASRAPIRPRMLIGRTGVSPPSRTGGFSICRYISFLSDTKCFYVFLFMHQCGGKYRKCMCVHTSWLRTTMAHGTFNSATLQQRAATTLIARLNTSYGRYGTTRLSQ